MYIFLGGFYIYYDWTVLKKGREVGEIEGVGLGKVRKPGL